MSWRSAWLRDGRSSRRRPRRAPFAPIAAPTSWRIARACRQAARMRSDASSAICPSFQRGAKPQSARYRRQPVRRRPLQRLQRRHRLAPPRWRWRPRLRLPARRLPQGRPRLQRWWLGLRAPAPPPVAMVPAAPAVPPLVLRPMLPQRRIIIMGICRGDALRLCAGLPPIGPPSSTASRSKLRACRRPVMRLWCGSAGRNCPRHIGGQPGLEPML